MAFNVYRGSTRVNATPITGSTNYLDTGAAAGAAYTVRAVVGGTEHAAVRVGAAVRQRLPRRAAAGPAGRHHPERRGVHVLGQRRQRRRPRRRRAATSSCVKWDPSNAKDNSQSGYTGNVFVDAYRLNGTRLWRIDLGRNIRAGAHYTQFQVYDYDGDGRAEVAMKTADGTRSGTGQVIGIVDRRPPQLAATSWPGRSS